MRIAVNTRLLLPGKLEGIGWFTHEVFSRIVQAHPEHEFIFLFDRKFDDRFIYADNVTPVVAGLPARHPILFRLWFQLTVTAQLMKHKADLFISPDGYLSLRTEVPSIPVIHDLNFEYHPEDLPKAHADYYRKYFPRFAKKAARIVTVSEFSKQDITKCYGIAGDHIDVVHNGVSKVFSPLDESEKNAAQKRFAEGYRYLISVGSLHPRKNVSRILEAFDRLKKAGDADTRLVIVGESFWWDKRMKSSWENVTHKDDVIFTGRLEQEDLRLAIGAAEALVYVSYYEGFGIPVAEAMKCGVPVVAANATSLPEVGGDAALYCDPFDVNSIQEAMQKVTAEAPLRKQLSEAGLERSKRYDWDKTAEGVWESMMKGVEG